MIGLPDPVARVNALISGQVDAINDVPASQISIITNGGKKVFAGKAGGWIPIYMDTTDPAFKDVRVRLAMKLLSDRPKMLAGAVSGHGLLANDLFGRWDPLYNSALPQRRYDPEKARALLKAAGASKTTFTLHASTVQAELMPQALVFQQSAKKAGVKINVVNEAADSFWDKVYGHVPFAFSSYGYRPFFAQWLNSFVQYNSYETKWNDASAKKAHKLVLQAASTFDPQRRKETGSRPEAPVGRWRFHHLLLQGADRRPCSQRSWGAGVRVPVPRLVPLLGRLARLAGSEGNRRPGPYGLK